MAGHGSATRLICTLLAEVGRCLRVLGAALSTKQVPDQPGSVSSTNIRQNSEFKTSQVQFLASTSGSSQLRFQEI